MDKNTIYGLILMALVFFGFMWLGPKPEETTEPTPAKEEQRAEEQAAPQTVDTLSSTEQEWLVRNLTENGTASAGADGRMVSRLVNDGIDLSVAGDSVFGSVTVNGKSYDWRVLKSASSEIPVDVRNSAIEKVRQLSNSMGRYGRFAPFTTGEAKTLRLENDALAVEFSSRGGVPVKAELKKYDTEYSADETSREKKRVVMFDSRSNTMAFTIPVPQEISTSELFFTPRQINDTTVLMTLDFAQDAYWGIEYTLPKGENYVVGIRIVQRNMVPVLQSNGRNLGFNWTQAIRRQEKGRMFEERNSGIYYKFAGGDVENLSESKTDSEERQAKVGWIAFKNQFFSSVMISKRPFNSADMYSEVIKGSDYLKSCRAQAEVNDYDWKAECPAEFDFYIGPNLYPLLSHLGKTLEPDENLELTRLIPLGWALFRWINTIVIIPVFNFLGSFISNYGIIILILTIFIKIVLFPLTYKSYKSQAKMRILAPDIKEINEKYPGNENAMTRQQKTMALYNKAGANPMSGCLPMLLQMPILIAMFTFFPSCIELRGEPFLWAHDLSAPDAIISWNTNIPIITEYFGNHISLFCLLMTAVNIIYTKINMMSNPGQTGPMKWMMYLMPVMFLVFFNNYAAGLSYYYFLSLLITIGQTYAFRLTVSEESVRKQMAENAKKPKKKSGFMARLEQMQKEQQAALREQQKRKR